MLPTLPHLLPTSFEPLRRMGLETLQVNLGYRCNQRCIHCHVAAGPHRNEQMDSHILALVLETLAQGKFHTLDVTGGAPELNPGFRDLVRGARALGIEVIDRCNLSILSEPGQEDLAEFLAAERVTVVASLPCYLEENVDRQRGAGAFVRSIAGLRRLNALGYGDPATGLRLDLVYNPQDAQLPPPQAGLEDDYRRVLSERHGVHFNHLRALANLPIQRFGSRLLSAGRFQEYLDLLRQAHRDENRSRVMCRTLVSVDWRGYLYDCDFNQMLDLPLNLKGVERPHLRDLIGRELGGNPIRVAEHCYGCTAGQGSSCGGALAEEPPQQ